MKSLKILIPVLFISLFSSSSFAQEEAEKLAKRQDSQFESFKRYSESIDSLEKTTNIYLSHFDNRLPWVVKNAFGMEIVRRYPEENELVRREIEKQKKNCHNTDLAIHCPQLKLEDSKKYHQLEKQGTEIAQQREIEKFNKGYALRGNTNQTEISTHQVSTIDDKNSYQNDRERSVNQKSSYNTPTNYRGQGSFKPEQKRGPIQSNSSLSKQ